MRMHRLARVPFLAAILVQGSWGGSGAGRLHRIAAPLATQPSRDSLARLRVLTTEQNYSQLSFQSG